MKFGLSEHTIQNIQNVFHSFSVVGEVILFGSRAKGNFKQGSDIDLALKGKNTTFDDILTLNIRLDALELPYKIDLVNYHTIKDQNVIDHINRVGIIFYAKVENVL